MKRLLEESELESAIRGIRLVIFDFDGVFTDNAVYISEEGTEWVRCWRGDGIGLRKLDRLGVDSLIMSTEVNPVVSMRAAKLRIECRQAVEDKRALLESLLGERGLALQEVAYVGNDINDLACMTDVGLSIGVADAHPDLDGCIQYRTRAPGGHGAVREICDLFERVHVEQPA